MTINPHSSGFTQDIVSDIESFAPRLVCFDYFDTIVTRRVHPEDVKKLCCERIARAVKLPNCSTALYALRNEIETAQCRQNEARGDDIEFRLHELFADLWERMPAVHILLKERFIQLAIDLETSIECSVQIVDSAVIEAIRILRASGRQCWLVSDIYLDKKSIARLLQFHGITDLFSIIKVSSETLSTKRSGKLYQQIITESGLEPSQIVMFGDNLHSDFNSAKAYGLHAVHLDRHQQHARYGELSQKTNDPAYAEAQVLQTLKGSGAVFKASALTLHFFVDQLHSHLLSRNVHDVFFLAREGQLLKKMFDFFQQTRRLNGTACIRSHYLEVSRRSTFLPSLKPIETEKFDTLFRQYRRISIKEFLASLGLDELEAELSAQIPFDLGARFDDLPTSAAFHALLTNSLFRRTYERERLTRRNAFQDYLNGFELTTSSNVMHIVDVGWKGTIQDNIFGILQNSDGGIPWNSIEGHYVGLVAAGSAASGNIKHGVVFSSINGISKNFHVFNENRALFEILLAADHGSAYSYRNTTRGTPEVIRQDFAEEPLYKSKIEPLQRQLFELFCCIDKILHIHTYPVHRLEGFVTRQHAHMLLQPSKAEITWFEDVYHVENFGVFESSLFDAKGKRPGLASKLRFYRGLRKSQGQLDLGFWPWLTCLQRGGSWVAKRYAASQTRLIKG